jgi:hypothetical protein
MDFDRIRISRVIEVGAIFMVIAFFLQSKFLPIPIDHVHQGQQENQSYGNIDTRQGFFQSSPRFLNKLQMVLKEGEVKGMIVSDAHA